MGRKHCGKRRNSLQAISPFPKVFSKYLYCRQVKKGLVWERINEVPLYQMKGFADIVVNVNQNKFDYGVLHFFNPFPHNDTF